MKKWGCDMASTQLNTMGAMASVAYIMCALEAWCTPWLSTTLCMVNRTVCRALSVTTLMGIFFPNVPVPGAQCQSIISRVVISPPWNHVSEMGAPYLERPVKKQMSYTSTVRIWAPTLKYYCYGFHICSMCSSNRSCDTMLGVHKNFKSPQSHNAATEPAFLSAKVSSLSCVLSFHITMFWAT